MSRKEGREPTNIEESVDTSIWRIDNYIQKSKKGLISMVSNIIDNIGTNRRRTRKQKSEEKQLYGYFEWQTD